MSTIAENLLALQQAKNDIKSAIESKGQDLTDVPFTEYGNKIGEMSASENLDTELNEQDTLLAELETQVNKLSDKPMDRLQWKCDNMKSLRYEFENCEVESVDEVLAGLDTSQVIDMSDMFKNATGLTSLDLSKLDTSNVTHMTEFLFCASVTPNLTELDFSGLKLSNVTSMYALLRGQTNLRSVNFSGVDLSSLKDASEMFYFCKSLRNINMDNVQFGSLTKMAHIYHDCKSIETVPLIDTSKVKTITQAHQNNFSLKEAPAYDTSSATSLSYLFYNCEALETVPEEYNTKACTNFSYMFCSCKSMKTAPKIDLRLGTNFSHMLSSCELLTNLNLKNIPKSLQIGSGTSWGHLLTLDSLLNTIKELWDKTGSTTQTLTVGTANLEKLANVYVKLVDITDEMRAEDEYIDNKLPFVQCESTDEGAMLISEYVTSKNWQLA